jgi:ferritin-like metal-binding protein YciE
MKKRIATLQDALIFVLQGMYYTESKLQENFSTCSRQVTSSALEKGIESYTEISKDQKLKIERIFNYLLSDTLSRINEVVDKLMSETLQMQEATTSAHLKDVMLIGCIQNINAYKLASYRTAYRLAVELELDTVTDLLQQILEWETETGKSLAALAMDEFYGMPDSYNTKV